MPKITEHREAKEGEEFLGGCGFIIPFNVRKRRTSEKPSGDDATTNLPEDEKPETPE